MPLIGINQPRGQNKESTLDKILKGFQIAQAALGTGLAIPKFLQDKEEFQTLSGIREKEANARIKGAEESRAFRESMLSSQEQGRKDAQKFKQEEADKSRLFQEKMELGQQDFQKGILAQRQAFDEKLLNITNTRKQLEEEEKKLKEVGERMVPALNQPAKSKKDAENINKALIGYKNVIDPLNKLIAEREARGGTMNPTTRSNARAVAVDIALTLKGPEFANLGVLTGPDLDLLLKQMPNDPLEFAQSTLLGFDDPITGKMKTLRNTLNTKMRNRLEVLGLEVPDGMFAGSETSVKGMSAEQLLKEAKAAGTTQ